jgi:hypothetical protein
MSDCTTYARAAVRAIPNLLLAPDEDFSHLTVWQIAWSIYDADLMLWSITYNIDHDGNIVRRRDVP